MRHTIALVWRPGARERLKSQLGLFGGDVTPAAPKSKPARRPAHAPQGEQLGLFGSTAPTPASPRPKRAPAAPTPQLGLFGGANDPSHGGALHQETRQEKRGGKTVPVKRWVSAPEAPKPEHIEEALEHHTRAHIPDANGDVHQVETTPDGKLQATHPDGSTTIGTAEDVAAKLGGEAPAEEPAPAEPEPAPEPETPAEEPAAPEGQTDLFGGAEPAAPAEPEPGEAVTFPDPAADPLAASRAVAVALMEGKITAEQLREQWQRYLKAEPHIKAWFQRLTVPQLKKLAGWTPSDKKDRLISTLAERLASRYHLEDGISWSPFTEKYTDAIGRVIDGYTDEKLQAVAAKVREHDEARKKAKSEAEERARAEREERERRMANPTTAEDYELLISERGRHALTPEQKIEADELIALRDRGRREAVEAAARAERERQRAAAAADARPSRDLTPEELEARIASFTTKVDDAQRAYAIAAESRSYGRTQATYRRNQAHAHEKWQELERWRRRLDHAKKVLEAKRGGGAMPADGADEAPAATAEAAPAAGPAPTSDLLKLHAGKHTKKGHSIWTAALEKRVDSTHFDALKAAAKRHGGYYSSYRGGGAIPGFVFDSEAEAHAFLRATGGQPAEAPQAAAEAPAPAAEAQGAASTPEGASEGASVAEEPADEGPEAGTPAARAARLRALADSTHGAAQEVLDADRLTNTHRRASMAAGMESEARGRQALARTMHNIADGMEAGTLRHLHGISSRRDVEELDYALRRAQVHSQRARGVSYTDSLEEHARGPTIEDVEHAPPPQASIAKGNLRDLLDAYEELSPAQRRGLGGAIDRAKHLHGHGRDTDGDDRWVALSDDDAQHVQAIAARVREHLDLDTRNPRRLTKWGLDRIDEDLRDHRRWRRMGIHSPEEMRAALREYLTMRGKAAKGDRLKEIQRELIGTKIPGYFPTPPTLARRAVAAADIQPGHRVLEPSAGSGHMAREIRDAHPDADLHAIEFNTKLQGYLREQGFNVVHHDHMAHDDPHGYDRIVMNPPFEHGQDAEHVRRAYDKLRPGGRLVAITSEGPFFRSDKKSQAFRDWLDEVGADHDRLPEGSFAGSDADRQTGVNTRMIVIDKPHDRSAEAGKARPRRVRRNVIALVWGAAHA